MSEQLSAFDLLLDDFNGQGLKKMQEQLLTMKNNLKHTMDAGLNADDFAIAKNLLQAVDTSSETIVQLHDKLAGGR
ncbi:MAG: hypothetical protein IJU79_01510 [Desulfovibrionaceae bacterium]|nr:hypothetical protein [Desulfovibrionaceae bacterium]